MLVYVVVGRVCIYVVGDSDIVDVCSGIAGISVGTLVVGLACGAGVADDGVMICHVVMCDAVITGYASIVCCTLCCG